LNGAHAQQRDIDIKFRLAQSYERGGDYENAVKIYEDLYSVDSSNYMVFEALRRGYTQLKRYSEAINLVESRLILQPNDLSLLSELGTLYNYNSDLPKAIDTWEEAIATAPKSEMTYRVVSNSMIESRLFENAIKVFERGRTALGKPTMFASDLAYLYGVMLNFTQATQEYLAMLREEPNQLASIISRISSYTGRPEGLDAAIKVVAEAQRASPEDPTLLQMLAWLYMEGKRYDDAYEVYRHLDKTLNAGGNEIYDFGERTLKEKAYRASANAFQEVITKYPHLQSVPQAKFGYARAIEDSTIVNDSLKLFGDFDPFVVNAGPTEDLQKRCSTVIAAYRKVVEEYPSTEIAAKSLLRIAKISYDNLFDLDAARKALEEIQSGFKQFGPLLQEAKLMLGNVLVASGDLEKARITFGTMTDFRTVSEETRELASLRIAELDYFDGKFADALKKIQDLTKNPAANITNDALSMNMFLQDNATQDTVALAIFSKGDLLQHEHKLADAMSTFQSLRTSHPNAPLVEDAMMRVGDLLAAMHRFPEAVAAYDSLLQDIPESIILDQAIIKKAKIYEAGLKDTPKAIDAYQSLLMHYPNSIYCSEARREIRELRGDTF
jgi:tetratricopeptide (TPR) repeat protein